MSRHADKRQDALAPIATRKSIPGARARKVRQAARKNGSAQYPIIGTVDRPANNASQYCTLEDMLPSGATYRVHCGTITHIEKNSATTRRIERSRLTFEKCARRSWPSPSGTHSYPSRAAWCKTWVSDVAAGSNCSNADSDAKLTLASSTPVWR